MDREARCNVVLEHVDKLTFDSSEFQQRLWVINVLIILRLIKLV